MRRPLLVFLAVGIAIGLVSPGAAAGTPPPVPTSAAVAGEPATVPAPAVGLRRPDGAALDGAIAEAMGRARDYAARVIAPRSVGEARASTLVIRGEPDSAPVSWRVQVTVTFVVR